MSVLAEHLEQLEQGHQTYPSPVMCGMTSPGRWGAMLVSQAPGVYLKAFFHSLG